ncbi:MAG: hypothetical protein LQ350_005861 [Teloschistes chrysophthalmus]|nr:MAG: hypothetical protein LQ350_005861 [Niorma chrysophthalma]
MAGTNLKRKAEQPAPFVGPAKRIDKGKREDESAPQNKRQEQTGQGQARLPVTRPPPRAQQAVPSFFQFMQRKGAKALSSQLNPTRTDSVEGTSKPASRAVAQLPKPKALAPKVQEPPRSVKAPSQQPPKTTRSEAQAKPAEAKTKESLAGVLYRKTTPPAASSTCASAAVGDKKPEEATKHVSPARKRKAEESMGGPTKKTKTESPSLVATSAPAVTVGASGPEEGTGGIAATLPPKRKAEESEEAPAKKKAKPDPLLKLCGMVKADGQLGKNKKPTVRTGTKGIPAGDKARTIKEEHSSPKQTQAASAKPTTPAGLDNNSNRCFGNVVMHALDSMPELRDHLISQCQQARAACEAQFLADDKDSERVKLDKKKKRQDAFERRMESSLPVCVGRHLEMMATSAKDGKPTTIRPLLQSFGRRNENTADYDGRQQQEAFDFFTKLIRQLGEEEEGTGGVVEGFFRGKMMALIECDACGKKRQEAMDASSSLHCQVPEREGPVVDLERCLEKAFAVERPEGYKCEVCKRENTSSKRDVVKKWGQYLVINCGRASFGRGWQRRKIATKIAIPSHLNLAKLMPDYKPLPANANANDIVIARFDSEPYRYEVIAVAQHHGTKTNGGHYTAHRKVGSEWFFCDDLSVSRSDLAHLKATTATMVLLRQG